MLRDEYFRRLVDAAYIDLYLSASGGAGGRVYWPWKMNPPKEALPRMKKTCESYVIDSDPLDDSVTTTDALDCGYRLNAEIVSLQDIYQDCSGTVKKLLEGLEIADSHRFDGQLLLPLQAPYVECWQELGEPTQHILGIGGLKNGTAGERIDAMRELRNAVGDEPHIHGFGWGINGIEKTIREKPDLIDSIDYSTPIQNAMNSSDYTPGDEMSSVLAMKMTTQLVRDLREVSSYVDENPEKHRIESQSGLEAYSP